MSEEIRREAEVSEQDLRGVSGDINIGPIAKASILCERCKPACPHCGGLVAYLKEHGITSVTSPQNCPYYNEAK